MPHDSAPTPDYRALFEATPGACLVLKPPHWRIVAVSDAYLRATMTDRAAIVGRLLFDVFPDNPDDLRATGQDNLETSLRTVCATRAPHAMAVQKYDIRRPDSEGGQFEERHWKPLNIPLLDASGEVTHILHTVQDVTHHARLEARGREQDAIAAHLRDDVAARSEEAVLRAQELQESNLRLRTANAFLDSIVENIPDMIFVKDANELRFSRFNRAGEQLLGVARTELYGKNDYDLFPKEQAEFFQAKDREVLRNGVLVDIAEEPIDTPKGQRWLHTKKLPVLDENGVPRFLLGISEDITERKRLADELQRANELLESRVEARTAELMTANAKLQTEIRERQKTTNALQRSEEQLRQAQKMEAIGRLAGGIAHDFNNLLSVILSYSSMAIADLEPGLEIRADLEEVMKAGERAAELTRQLLAFSRQQVLSPKVVDLNSVIAAMDRILRRVIGEDIELRVITAPNLGKVKIDIGQMEQVIMNLAVNARDAMPTGGSLTIETANVDLDGTYAGGHVGVRTGPHVLVAVTDTGIGMDKATQARIYEPFYTTKETGKGTGLGLATVFGIVQQSGGTIWHYSEVGKGTCFKIYLPRSLDDAEAIAVTGAPQTPTRGTETIVLVEDEEQVRVLACDILRRSGYKVIEAKNGWEALLLCERFEERIDLLVTDVVMPKMNGRELAERIKVIRPETKILFMSGYTDDTVVHHGVLDSEFKFLQKPITPSTLTKKVREVLDAAAGAPGTPASFT